MHWAITSLGDHLPSPYTGEIDSHAERHRQIVDLAVEAEHLGARSVHLGEHHFCDYILAAPAVMLTAIAMRTSTLRLSTAVTLLAHHDPVLLAEEWATLDLLSEGRSEMVIGRGVVADLYRQFGQDQAESRAVTAENIDLLRALWTTDNLDWEGSFRAPLSGVTSTPKPLQAGGPPIWLAVSSAESIAEAVRLRCPATIALVSTGFEGGATVARDYRAAWAEAGLPPEEAYVAVNVHCFISDRGDAKDYWAPYQFDYLRWVLKLVTGQALPLEEGFPFWSTLEPPLAQAVCGSPAEVTDRLAVFNELAGGVDLWLFHGDQGGLPDGEVVESMNLFAEEVFPHLD